MMRLLVAINLLLLILPSLVLAPLQPDRELPDVRPVDWLLHFICRHETGDKTVPSRAVSPHGSAWGRCQIKYWSAVAFGGFDEPMRRTGIPSRNPGELFDDLVNLATARKILDFCRRKYPLGIARRLAYCWLAGPGAKPYRHREGYWFSKRVAEDVAVAKLKLLRPQFLLDKAKRKKHSKDQERETPCCQQKTTPYGKPASPPQRSRRSLDSTGTSPRQTPGSSTRASASSKQTMPSEWANFSNPGS